MPDVQPARETGSVIPTPIGLLSGGWGFERYENLAAACSIGQTLASYGHQLTTLDLTRPSDLSRLWQSPFLGVPFYFMAVTEELLVHPLLEAAKIGYSGSPAPATAIFYDKWTAGQILTSSGVAVPRTQLLRTGFVAQRALTQDFPKIVKPRRGGASVGVSLIASGEQLAIALKGLAEIDDWALVQDVVAGIEYTSFFLNSHVLGCLEVGGVGEFWTHEQKRLNSRTFTPCRELSIIDEFERVGQVLSRYGVQSLSRVDAIASPKGLIVLDVNTQPYLGATPGGSVQALCDMTGLTHYELLQLIYKANDGGRNSL
ncbi:ATP-grasp domain-containing protein [Streptomyces sp. NBC_01231]|nr:ATP-grasp domain-containing protein [Streptomyces sp. NBC_01231]